MLVIDWRGLALGSLWVSGLALMLAALSHAAWVASNSRRPLHRIWNPGYDLAVNAGGILVALPLLLARDAWWQRLLALACMLGFAALAAGDLNRWRRGAGAPAHQPLRRARLGTESRPFMLWRQSLFPLALLAVLLALAGSQVAFGLVAPILLYGLLGRVVRGDSIVGCPTDWPVGLIVLVSLVGAAISVDRTLSLSALRNLLAGVGLSVATVRWADSPRRVGLAALTLILVGTGLALLAPFAQMRWATEKYFTVPGSLQRLAFLGEAIHSNVLAGALVVVLPVNIGLLLWPWGEGGGSATGRIWRAGLAACMALMLAMLVLTQSRGGLAAFVASLAVLALLRWRWARLVVAGCAVAAGVAIWVMGFREAATALAGGSVGTFQTRVEAWPRAIYMLQDFPFTGIGLGTFEKVAPILYPYFDAGAGSSVPHAHNLFLQVGVDLGIPGLIGFLALLMLSVFMAWQVWLRAMDWRFRSLAAGLLSSQVALILHGLTDAPVWTSKPAFVVWMVLGLTAAAWRAMWAFTEGCEPTTAGSGACLAPKAEQDGLV